MALGLNRVGSALWPDVTRMQPCIGPDYLAQIGVEGPMRRFPYQALRSNGLGAFGSGGGQLWSKLAEIRPSVIGPDGSGPLP